MTTRPEPPEFGAELRRRRQAASLSLAGLAGKVHYSRGYLSKIETGASPPNLALAERCDAALETGGVLAAMLLADPTPPRRRGAWHDGKLVGLPRDAAYFVGRTAEVDELLAVVSGRRPADADGAEGGSPG